MTNYVVTEGSRDVEILSAVARQFLPGRRIVFVDGQGKSNAVSLARSLLSARKQPVAFVVDADTVDRDLIHEQRQTLESLLGLVAVRSLWTAALFEPTLERCLFRDLASPSASSGGCSPSGSVFWLNMIRDAFSRSCLGSDGTRRIRSTPSCCGASPSMISRP